MEKDDTIVFKYEETTLNYKVVNATHGYFLANRSGGLNKQIFNLLKIENRFMFCENVIGYPIKDKEVDFPEVKTLEDLEKIVDALYQRIIDISVPKFKEGEKVKIIPKDGPRTSYPCVYLLQMEKLANTTSIISKVIRMSVTGLKEYIQCEEYEEPFIYYLKDNLFNWTSAMLEFVSKDNNKKEEVPPKFNMGDKVKVKTLDKDHRYGVYLNPAMLKYSNQEFIIACRNNDATILNKECDGYTYSLMDVYGWVWSSDMLEKSENKTKHKLDTAPWTASEPRDLSVMQKESIEIYDAITTNSILLPPELAKADINTQTVIFGNIKTTTGTISFKEEKDSNVDYKLNFNVKPLKF